MNFENSLHNLDIKLFEKISSQTTDGDKSSLLAIQNAVREMHPGYIYLEIGSYLGGSIQPHLLDEKCRIIYSIDKRPLIQPDERGIDFIYQSNSTARMLEKLKTVTEVGHEKIQCFDGDASEIDKSKINPRPQVCFIDGEHTDVAAWNDFEFCMDVVAENGAIVFHDAAIIYNCLRKITDFLEKSGRPFKAYNLSDVIFVVDFGYFYKHKSIQNILLNNYQGYLTSLQFNDNYRRFAHKPIVKWIRKFRSKLLRNNISE
jgi:Methyltransferase domain